MVVIAVIVGYILGIAPFVAPKIIERIDTKKELEESKEAENEQEETFNEWIYGQQENKETVNQQDLYNEYMTGKVVKGA